jgi:hypothetical protein
LLLSLFLLSWRMAMSFLPMILMFLGTSGSMNELLDLTDPRSYLEAQGIEYRVEAMLEVLAEPASKDLDTVKAQEVKKLLAMRALGALGDKAALPALEKAAAEKALFFDDYASAAIAAIEGKEYTTAGASADDLKADLALLPEGIGLVMQAQLDGGGKMDLRKVVGEALKAMPDAPQPDEVLKQVNGELGKIAGKIGNVRIDAVTFGLSADVGNDAGFAVVIARGKYDHRALESFLAEQRNTANHQIGGTMFLGIGGDNAALAPVSSERLILVTGAGWEHLPLKGLAARLKAQPTEPAFGKKLQKVIARADQSGSIWGAGLISEGMKEAPPLAPFDEIVLSTRELEGKGKTQLMLEGIGSDAASIKESVEEMEQTIGQGIAEIEQHQQPGMAPIVGLMKGMKFTSKGLKGSISAEFDGKPANLVSLLVSMFASRAAHSIESVPPPP